MFLVLRDEPANLIDLFTTEAPTPYKPKRIEPKLRRAIIAIDVHVRGLAPVASVKEEAKRSESKDSRHLPMVRHSNAESNCPGTKSS